jgi:hypothetical protein
MRSGRVIFTQSDDGGLTGKVADDTIPESDSQLVDSGSEPIGWFGLYRLNLNYF